MFQGSGDDYDSPTHQVQEQIQAVTGDVFFCSVWNNLLSQFICRSNAWRIDFPYASVFNTQAIYNYRVNAPL